MTDEDQDVLLKNPNRKVFKCPKAKSYASVKWNKRGDKIEEIISRGLEGGGEFMNYMIYSVIDDPESDFVTMIFPEDENGEIIVN